MFWFFKQNKNIIHISFVINSFEIFRGIFEPITFVITKKNVCEQLYKELYARDSQPGFMYALSKYHKPLIKNFPKLRRILSGINTATYSWAKFLFPYLNVSL